MKKLYLVDVSSMFFRAFYAIPPLHTAGGLPTNALYGFLSMSIKLLRESRPDYMVFCFDRKEPSFRSEIYEEYKANRTEMPDDLEPQIPFIREITEKLGVQALDKLGYEADDIIGTLAKWGEAQKMAVSIVSCDKDFAQLVNDNITLYDTMKNIRYDRPAVVEKWGVNPEQIIDYLAIVGDTSDNIPGVRGVGPKGAQKLLSEFKTLQGVYDNLDKISSASLKQKLQESKEAAFLAQKLVTIVTDVNVDISADDFVLKPIDKEAMKALLSQLEFDAFSRKLFNDAGSDANGTDTKTPGSVRKTKEKTTDNKDAESSSPASISAGASAGADRPAYKNVQWSLAELKKNIQPYEEIWAVKTERGFCLGYDNKAIQIDARLEEIGEVLGPKTLSWKGYNVKSLWHAVKLKDPTPPKWDTQLAAYVIKAGAIGDFADVYKQYTQKALPDLASPEDVLACERELADIFSEKLEHVHGRKVLDTYELPLVPVLYGMETRGILIDKAELKQQSESLTTDIHDLETAIHKMAGESFNIASPKQLAQILFEKLKVPVVKKTKTGYSTDSDVLSKLAPQYPICDKIITYRELAKLKSTYVDSLPALVDAHDNRLHTHFQQAVTQTGRLSSTNPNLQNIPIRTERGRAIRKAFIAKKDHVFLSVDYSQVELRVLAEITGDPGLTEAFQKDLDIHAATAAEVFNVSLSSVTPEQRRMAKAVNFGIAYGQGVYGLAETLEISREQSKEIIENYFKKFKKVKDYMMDTVQLAQEQGYVESLFGRRRYMDEFKSSSAMVRKFGERAAINAPIQGTASDLMKKAMIEVYENSPAPLLLQVHDELLFECPEAEIEFAAQSVKETMENVAKFKVPLKVNIAWGKNWEDAHA